MYVDQWENERQNLIRKQQKSKFEVYIKVSNLVIGVKHT